MRIRPEIRRQPAAGAHGWLWDPRTGSVFGLNRSSAFLLDLLAGGAAEAELPERLAEAFGLEAPAAVDDTRAFLRQLAEHDLVEL
ncbi:MAG: HPr-rel-A system PqqD family peptide chaperone [Planctomycetes bacterium]|nr:HPr-rel-A system PqqD family peptide chaperone [Planctomycetota bacterium]